MMHISSLSTIAPYDAHLKPENFAGTTDRDQTICTGFLRGLKAFSRGSNSRLWCSSKGVMSDTWIKIEDSLYFRIDFGMVYIFI
jgi:hypothetical protein